jgi:hypothetical protein
VTLGYTGLPRLSNTLHISVKKFIAQFEINEDAKSKSTELTDWLKDLLADPRVVDFPVNIKFFTTFLNLSFAVIKCPGLHWLILNAL